MSGERLHDPRTRLAREKYFSLRPKPLERWLWAQGITASAERVFWLHWQEGQQRGDWCSEIPLRRVARECQLDVSTVTRAYQRLAELGCLRRTDPGRDPANPFQQATAITEVRIPKALLLELERHPNRRVPAPATARIGADAAVDRPEPSPPPAPQLAPRPAIESAAPAPEPTQPPPGSGPPAPLADPFAGLRGRDRLRALARLTHAMSAAESRAYRDAQRRQHACMNFDPDSRLGPDEQGRVTRFLAAMAAVSRSTATSRDRDPARTEPAPARAATPRRMSDFEIAGLRRDLQALACPATAPELLREVLWSVEEGALRRFTPVHALRIALKKIREGAWTRPHRLPPQWARDPGRRSHPETCHHAR